MPKRRVLAMCAVTLALATGCQHKLREVRSETKFGPAFKHKTSKKTDSVRWSVQQGIELKWNKGLKTGVTYRRRDTDNGFGNRENAVFFDFSFPLWKAEKKPNPLKKRVKKLERRIEQLEALIKKQGAQ